MSDEAILLSILIPTVIGREDKYNSLFSVIMKQIEALPENYRLLISINKRVDNKEMTIGEKRELLYRQAAGDYSWQIDDDDSISDNAIKLILEAIKQNPDCITFREHCMMDGKEYKSNHSLEYADWEGDGSRILEDGFHFHRTPFMKSVIKTEIARSVPIPHIRYGEDHQWAQALKPHLKTEVHIPEDIYFYQHQSSDPTERYGLDK